MRLKTAVFFFGFVELLLSDNFSVTAWNNTNDTAPQIYPYSFLRYMTQCLLFLKFFSDIFSASGLYILERYATKAKKYVFARTLAAKSVKIRKYLRKNVIWRM